MVGKKEGRKRRRTTKKRTREMNGHLSDFFLGRRVSGKERKRKKKSEAALETDRRSGGSGGYNLLGADGRISCRGGRRG